jgi:hypothetical protein
LRQSVAAALSIRVGKKLPRVQRVRLEFHMCFQHFLGVAWRTLLWRRARRAGINFTLREDAIARCQRSSARKPPVFLRSSSQSIPLWPGCENAIFEMASKNF